MRSCLDPVVVSISRASWCFMIRTYSTIGCRQTTNQKAKRPCPFETLHYAKNTGTSATIVRMWLQQTHRYANHATLDYEPNTSPQHLLYSSLQSSSTTLCNNTIPYVCTKLFYSKHFSRLYNTPPHKVTTTPPPHKITNTANQHHHNDQIITANSEALKPRPENPQHLEFSTHSGNHLSESQLISGPIWNKRKVTGDSSTIYTWKGTHSDPLKKKVVLKKNLRGEANFPWSSWKLF